MNKQNFTTHDRFPLSVESLDFMQNMITMVQELSRIGGEKYILSGCNVTGNQVDKGYLVIEGEILPFEGGTENSTITIVEEEIAVTVNNVDFDKVRIERKAIFASGTGSNYYNWNDFKSLPTNLQLAEEKADITYVNDEIAKHQGSTVPKGIIVMWSGAINAIPSGWALCNGQTVEGVLTPNLSGRFIVGYNSGDSDFLPIGYKAGDKDITLSARQQGYLDIKMYRLQRQNYKDNKDNIPLGGMNINGTVFPMRSLEGYENKWDDSAQRVLLSKAQESFKILPPYYVLAYIIKL